MHFQRHPVIETLIFLRHWKVETRQALIFMVQFFVNSSEPWDSWSLFVLWEQPVSLQNFEVRILINICAALTVHEALHQICNIHYHFNLKKIVRGTSSMYPYLIGEEAEARMTQNRGCQWMLIWDLNLNPLLQCPKALVTMILLLIFCFWNKVEDFWARWERQIWKLSFEYGLFSLFLLTLRCNFNIFATPYPIQKALIQNATKPFPYNNL